MNKEFQQELFGILVTVLLLTAFELWFFAYVAAPTIERTTRGLVNNLGKIIRKNNEKIFQIPPNIMNSVQEEEARLIEKVNKGILRDGMWIGATVFIMLIYLVYTLKKKDGTDKNIFKVLFTQESLIFIFGSFLLFALFQTYFFFYVSQEYWYLESSESEFAAKKSLLNSIENNLSKK